MRSRNIVLTIVGMLAAVGALGVTKATKAQAATNNLGDLFVLGVLFGNNNSSGILSNNGSGMDLGDLIILDQLFGGGKILGGSGSKKTNLGNLLILNQLFNNSGLFGSQGGTNNLGRLFVLDRLFSGTSAVLGGAPTNTSARRGTPASKSTSSTLGSADSSVGTGSTQPDQVIVQVSLSDGSYVSATLTVRVGDTVQWINHGSGDSAVTAEDGSFDSGVMPPGKIFLETFNEPGRYMYHVSPNSSTIGTIVVK